MNARKQALDALVDILEDGAYANLRLKDVGDAAVHALVYQTLEHLYYTDYVLQQYAKRQKRVVRNILRLAATELLFMHEPPYAVINEAVELCKRSGKRESAGLCNAVLRRVCEGVGSPPPLPVDPVSRMSIRYSYPAWIVALWCAELGQSTTEELLQAPGTGMEIRAQYPYTAEALSAALTEPYTRGSVDSNCFRLQRGIDIRANALFSEGAVTVQNQGSMAVCRALGDMRGKTVLDACAAPGGKTAYLYSLAEGDVRITAWELHAHRKELLDATLSRLHVQATTETRDASVFCEQYVGQFDAVLLDVPCSGLGLLRDKADIRYNRKEEDLTALAALQRSILDACCQYVRPGGVLLYSTCTISRAENAQQVQGFLDRHHGFSLSAERQLLPNLDGVDGFYYARMDRCS